MCLLCVEIQEQNMTVKEVAQAYKEFQVPEGHLGYLLFEIEKYYDFNDFITECNILESPTYIKGNRMMEKLVISIQGFHSLPTLYKKTGNGALQKWNIQVEDGVSPVIVTEFGQIGGKLQTSREFIKEGKNLGKKNETTAFEQAIAEAKSKWEL